MGRGRGRRRSGGAVPARQSVRVVLFDSQTWDEWSEWPTPRQLREWECGRFDRPTVSMIAVYVEDRPKGR